MIFEENKILTELTRNLEPQELIKEMYQIDYYYLGIIINFIYIYMIKILFDKLIADKENKTTILITNGKTC